MTTPPRVDPRTRSIRHRVADRGARPERLPDVHGAAHDNTAQPARQAGHQPARQRDCSGPRARIVGGVVARWPGRSDATPPLAFRPAGWIGSPSRIAAAPRSGRYGCRGGGAPSPEATGMRRPAGLRVRMTDATAAVRLANPDRDGGDGHAWRSGEAAPPDRRGPRRCRYKSVGQRERRWCTVRRGRSRPAPTGVAGVSQTASPTVLRPAAVRRDEQDNGRDCARFRGIRARVRAAIHKAGDQALPRSALTNLHFRV
jgi:hypothetical protein